MIDWRLVTDHTFFRSTVQMHFHAVLSLLHAAYIVCLLPRCMECRRGLAMRILSVCHSVRLSVRPSVKRVLWDKMVERSVQIFISYERSF